VNFWNSLGTTDDGGRGAGDARAADEERRRAESREREGQRGWRGFEPNCRLRFKLGNLPCETLLGLLVLLPHTHLLAQEIFLDLPVMKLQSQTRGLLLKLSPLQLRRLLQPHELLIVLLAEEELLLLHALVHLQVEARLLLVRLAVQHLRALPALLPKLRAHMPDALIKGLRVLLLLVLYGVWVR
jgi:hypothetical protein